MDADPVAVKRGFGLRVTQADGDHAWPTEVDDAPRSPRISLASVYPNGEEFAVHAQASLK
jgi:hypothetical protein